MNKFVLVLLVNAVVLIHPNAWAKVNDRELLELKTRLEEMTKRLKALEANNNEMEGNCNSTVQLCSNGIDLTGIQKEKVVEGWGSKISLTGDFRYRYESIDEEGKDFRERNRLRARMEVKAELPDNIKVGIGLASGGADALSTNQTLGNGGTSKDFGLDMAYFDWKINNSLNLRMGKFKNPLYLPEESGLIWDSDYRPEGVSFSINKRTLFVTFMGNWIESDSQYNDELSWAVQIGSALKFGDTNLTMAVGYLDFPVEGREAIYGDGFLGNSSRNNRYIYDYGIFNVGADLEFSMMKKIVNIYADYIKNSDAKNADQGYIVGAKIKLEKWQFKYQYEDIEADATLASFTDADFGGGGTNAKGHKFAAKYYINEQWAASATYLNNSLGASQNGQIHYDRFQLDAEFKF